MGLQPNIQKEKDLLAKDLLTLRRVLWRRGLRATKSVFYIDGVIPICNQCVDTLIYEHGADWSFVDKLCQMSDIPFVPKEWTKLYESAPRNAFLPLRPNKFLSSEYDGLGWGEYFEAYTALKAQNQA